MTATPVTVVDEKVLVLMTIRTMARYIVLLLARSVRIIRIIRPMW
eukprot:SAG11_NODE_3933_length_2143_cov_2.172211_4_plen_45_part_00